MDFRFGLLTIGLLVVVWFLGRPVAEHIVTGRIEAKAVKRAPIFNGDPYKLMVWGSLSLTSVFNVKVSECRWSVLWFKPTFAPLLEAQIRISAIKFVVQRYISIWHVAKRRKSARPWRAYAERLGGSFWSECLNSTVEPSIEILSPNGRERVTVSSPLLRMRPASAGYRLGGVIHSNRKSWDLWSSNYLGSSMVKTRLLNSN